MMRSLYSHRPRPISPSRTTPWPAQRLSRLLLAGLVALLFASGMTTAVRADTQGAWRVLVRAVEKARVNGWVVPDVGDPERYPQHILDQAAAMAQGGGDDCKTALRVALFLDANRFPTVDEYLVHAWNAGLVGDLFGIFVMKNEFDAAKALTIGGANGVVSVADGLNKLVLTSDAILNVNSEVALKNRAAWLEEIVALGLRKGWDAETVALADQRIEARIWDNINTFPKIDAELVRALDAAAVGYDRRVMYAEEKRDVAIRSARGMAEKIKTANGQFNSDILAAKAAFVAAENAARAKAARDIGQALQNIAKARVQRDALHRYILPVSEGRCAEVHKEGPLPVAACTGESCPAPAPDPTPDPAFVPPEGGYWALVGSIGRVYENLNEHECYETRGTVGDGSASYSDAEVACSSRWGPITASYTWSSPPAALVPGQEYPVSASISGSYIEGHGGADLSIDMDVAGTECGARTGGHIAIIRPDGDGGLETNWNREHEDAWSGTFTAPGESFGESEGDNAPRFQIKASPYPVGCYRYIYEWRE